MSRPNQPPRFPWYRCLWNLLWAPVGILGFSLVYIYTFAVHGPSKAKWEG